MKRTHRISTILFAWAIVPTLLLAGTGEVTRRWPTPGRCPTGLAYDGQSLWLADRRTDLLYQIDPRDGQVLKTLTAPGYQIEGLTVEGTFLWALDVDTKQAFKLNPNTGITEQAIRVYCDSPQGLAFDGKDLWVADLKTKRLHQISTQDGTTIKEIPSPADDPHGITHDGEYLWVSDRTADMIYRVLPEDGSVHVAFASPSKFPRGLAFDGAALWNVDYQTDTIYQIQLQDEATQVRLGTKRETLEYVHQVRNYGPGELTSLDIYLAIPSDLPTQKILKPLKFAPEPTGFVTDQWGQKMAHYHFDRLPAGRFATVAWEADVALYRTRYFLFPEKVGSLSDIPAEIKERYLSDGAKYCIHDPYIQKTARDIVGKETNGYWMARKIFGHLIRKMDYDRVGGWNIAPTVLRRGSGSCSEFSFAFIALCRAVGLPARYVGSVVIRGDDASTDNGVFHRWPEVYLPNFGWVPMDPSRGRRLLARPADQMDVVGYRDSRYLITTVSGGGSEYLQWEYNSQATWQSQGPCKVQTERYGEWSPLQKSDEE